MEEENTRLEELRHDRKLYKELEETIITGGAISYEIGGKTLTRYNVSLSEVRRIIKELDEEISAELGCATRFHGRCVPID